MSTERLAALRVAAEKRRDHRTIHASLNFVLVSSPGSPQGAEVAWETLCGIVHVNASGGDTIIDTHGGSMSSAVACVIEGFDCTVCEIDADYFTAGSKRVRAAEQIQRATPKLFTA